MADHDDLHRLGLKLKFAYSMVGLFLGLACIVAGVILGLSGVAGHTTWTASLLGLETNLNDATPGVIIFVVGIFFVLITVSEQTTLPQSRESQLRQPQPREPQQSPLGGGSAGTSTRQVREIMYNIILPGRDRR